MRFIPSRLREGWGTGSHPAAPVLLALSLLLASCSPALRGAAPATVGVAARVQTAARAVDLPFEIAAVPMAGDASALAAFHRSCPGLRRREDLSGLTRTGDWDAACNDLERTAPAFFSEHFQAVAVGDGAGFATGYFEPEIAGSRIAGPGYPAAFYRPPADLVEVDLGVFAADLKGRKVRGRIEGGALVPYATRGQIAAGALAGRGLELAFAADPLEAFFLEIQGSGRLRLPDGGVMRIGYASQNGHAYVAIGKILLDRGELVRGKVSMESILGWLRSHPAEAPALLAANPSQVFFREIIGEGPIGAMGVAVTAGISVAADPAFIPLGAPLFVETRLPDGRPVATMMVAQDTGGAIKGANRIDLFRGAGDTARAEAGGMAAAARVVMMLPKAAVERLARKPIAAADAGQR